MAAKTVFVISDLHVGCGDKFDIFHSGTKLDSFEGFIEHARTQPSPVELIINGDLVDFLQVRPWNDLSPQTAFAKASSIAEKSAPVFRALGNFLAVDSNEITILLGNHDVELVFPEVWAVVRDKILESAPDAANRLAIRNERSTYRLAVNGVKIHVEHGNADDEWNSVNYASLIDAAEIGTAVVYPAGTRLVYDTMNKLKDELQFVDVLKPEVPAVILLLLTLKPWESLKGLPGLVSQQLRAMANSWLLKLQERIGGRMCATQPDPNMSPDESLSEHIASSYISSLPDVSFEQGDINELGQYLGLSDARSRGMGASFGGAADSVKIRLIDAALNALARFRMISKTGSSFSTDDQPEDAFAISASKRFEGDVQVVIFGHTHEALKTEVDENRVYINSGTWANLVRLPDRGASTDDRLNWLRSLQDNTFARTSFPTFVRLDESAKGAVVGLYSWDGTATLLWSKTLTKLP